MRRLVLLVALLGCHGKPKQAVTLPPTVQVKDASGALQAELRPLRPCRGSVGAVELIVGGPPLVAQIGNTRWSGDLGSDGTTLSRDDEAIARVTSSVSASGEATAILDMHGLPVARIAIAGTRATVLDGTAEPLRSLTQTGPLIVIDKPALTVTGTDDLTLAALLASPEVVPEIRILAACERVLVKGR